jgi:nucleotide-binding universal stress UspA family protein
MNHFPKRILLATDGSEDTAQATTAAIDIAKGSGSELHVIHVWHDVHTPHAHAFVKSELRQQGREILDKEVKRIGRIGGLLTRSHLREGRTFEEVMKVGDEIEACLLVVGSRGLRGMRRMLLGSHSEDIVHHSHRPVLVVLCGEKVWPPARIVVGDDLSEDARKAAELAANLAKLFGARMLLLHAAPPLQQGSSEAVEAKLADRAGKLEDMLQYSPQTNVVAGDPAEVLMEATREGGEPSILAVGSRGLGLVGRLRLGSVSTKVIRAGLGTVLVCPHVEER